MWFLWLAFSPYPTFFLSLPHCLFLSQCEEEDVSHHAHPIWEDPPLLQRSCECLSLSMATHDCPSPSLQHAQVSKAILTLLSLALVKESFQWAATYTVARLTCFTCYKIQKQNWYFATRHWATTNHQTWLIPP